MSANPSGIAIEKTDTPSRHVEYSTAPFRLRPMECTTEIRLIESLFLLTDDARDNRIIQLMEALSIPSQAGNSSVVRYMNLKLGLYDPTYQQLQRQGQQEVAVQGSGLNRRPPWIYLGGQYVRSVTRITALGRTSAQLQHLFLTVPNSQIDRDFNNRAEDTKYRHLMPGDVPERQFASAEGVVIFILWQQDENGHQFFKPHPGPLQDRTLVAPPFVDLLRRQAPSRSDAVGSPRPENAFRLDILLRRSDEDELGHTTNSRVPALIYEALVYGLNNGYYANGSGPCITSSSLPTCVSKTASGSQTIAVPAGSKFYKSGNIRELYVGYERELKVKPGVYVWSWVERTRIQGQLDVIQFEVCSEDDQGKEKVLSLCRIIIQEYQRPAQLASL